MFDVKDIVQWNLGCRIPNFSNNLVQEIQLCFSFLLFDYFLLVPLYFTKSCLYFSSTYRPGEPVTVSNNVPFSLLIHWDTPGTVFHITNLSLTASWINVVCVYTFISAHLYFAVGLQQLSNGHLILLQTPLHQLGAADIDGALHVWCIVLREGSAVNHQQAACASLNETCKTLDVHWTSLSWPFLSCHDSQIWVGLRWKRSR